MSTQTYVHTSYTRIFQSEVEQSFDHNSKKSLHFCREMKEHYSSLTGLVLLLDTVSYWNSAAHSMQKIALF